MDMPTTPRTHDLIAGSQRFARRPGWFARLVAPGFERILGRIDSALTSGTIHGVLPDGSRRTLGGHAPGFECEVELRSWNALIRLASNGSVGWYQAWEAGEWWSPDPVPLFALFMQHASRLGDTARAKGPFRHALKLAHLVNRNTHEGARKNISAHYDLGNDFYAAWLDPTMSYSSALEPGDDGLEAAQRRKWDALATRIGTAREVLEIGCGWGGLASFLAARGADVTAISLSDEQLAWAAAHHGAGVDFRKQDYRDCEGQFDAIVSVEMVEALGREYWPTFMDCIARNLKPGGRAAIQYIAMRDDLFDAYAKSADFIQAYIFPGGLLIRTSEFRRLAEERGLAWRDQRDFGGDYAATLEHWRHNFDAAAAAGHLPEGFDEQFCDLWRYYLMYCEGGFRGGGIDVHQVTLVKEGEM
ncbi:cyclopropane-fatty-acyl-phospholipid synthase family protein [Qipengyuania profunda]|jgi:cyclopropane-fatty-acyl-phospholipid synthase|uniref:cyclopropane-fatty-acyl-phospholipid synthase family protein n=1 Tax=Qipengyuania profunda TaxID=3113984 RepID=UPI002A18A61C|nr:cyclopropane-fatty-acyl-phospholipid synthase family protein [Qipengyuania sp. HL-TH1]WPL55805.1 cyclopropane-fatty-acyl-phospholipid synthase family protein [Qipengyuania sp. HL-TH5]